MAHEFYIKNKRTNRGAFFFGYANGLMYEAFLEKKHDAFVSGDGGTETKTKAETITALDSAIKAFDLMEYPDASRLDKIKQFRQDMEGDDKDDVYFIWFG